jgi:histidine ammonia-lyase
MTAAQALEYRAARAGTRREAGLRIVRKLVAPLTADRSMSA